MTEGHQGDSGRGFRTHAGFVAVLVCAGLLAYSNNFTAEFVYDDYPFILNNPAVKSLSNPGRFFTERGAFSEGGRYVIYRPLAALSFALNYRLGGSNPAAFHVVNIGLHVGCGFALYLLLCATLKKSVFALFGSLLFLLHPVQTEAVAWISGRANSMFLLFLLLTCVCYKKWSADIARGRIYYWLALVLAALSLLSKEMAVALPVLLLVYDGTVNRPERRDEWRVRFLGLVPFAALSISYILLRHAVLGETRQIGYWGGGPWMALLTMTRGFAYYARLMFVPRPLMVEYMMPIARSPFQLTVLVSILLLSLIGALCVLSWRRAPVLSFGVGWFFASLIPVSNIVPLKAIINERFLYLPSIGFCTILAYPLLMREPTDERAARGFVAALCMIALCYGALTFDRNMDWRDPLSLWTASVKASPAGPTSRYNLGIALYNRGRYEEAAEQLRMACVLQEKFPSAHGALGNVYIALGRYEEAVEEFETALAQAPGNEDIRRNLAAAWFEKGRMHDERDELEAAARCFLNALKYDPDFVSASEALRALRGG